MKPLEKNIENPRGDTFAFAMQCPKTVTVESMYFTISSVKDMKDEAHYLVHKSIGDGIVDLTKEEDEKQTWQIRVAPEDTNNLKPGKYFYDYQVGFGADIYTLLEGRFCITIDFTREIS